jgi:Domain of unknown function (DUF397)
MTNGQCVEVVSLADDVIAVRDSKNPCDGVLRFTTAEWDAFIDGAHNGNSTASAAARSRAERSTPHPGVSASNPPGFRP